jgi:hypothetical protein
MADRTTPAHGMTIWRLCLARRLIPGRWSWLVRGQERRAQRADGGWGYFKASCAVAGRQRLCSGRCRSDAEARSATITHPVRPDPRSSRPCRSMFPAQLVSVHGDVPLCADCVDEEPTVEIFYQAARKQTVRLLQIHLSKRARE